MRIGRDMFDRFVCDEIRKSDVLYYTGVHYRAQLIDNLFEYHWRRQTGAGRWSFGAMPNDGATCFCKKEAYINVELGKLDEFRKVIGYQIDREARSYVRIKDHLSRVLRLRQSRVLSFRYLSRLRSPGVDIVGGAFSSCQKVQNWVFGNELPRPAERSLLARRCGVPVYEEARLMAPIFFDDTMKTRSPIFMQDTNYGSSDLGHFLAESYYDKLFLSPMPPLGHQHWYDLALYALATIVTCQCFGDGNKRMGRLIYTLILSEGRMSFIEVDRNDINRLGNLLANQT